MKKEENTEIVPNENANANVNQPEKKNTCRIIWNWLLQISLWIYLFKLFNDLVDFQVDFTNLIITLVIYLVYIINNTMLSTTSALLENMLTSQNIKEYMQKLFSKKIKRIISIQNYHYEIDLLSKSNRKKRIVTSKEEIEFQYLSWRDTSGTLDLTSAVRPGEQMKPYLGINLSYEMAYENEETKNDYDNFVKEIKEINKNKDESMDFKVNDTIEGFEKNVLVRLGDKEDFFVNPAIYYLSVVIIPTAELYKLYFTHLCEYKSFSIIKTVSTRNKIHLPAFDQKFEERTPTLKLQGGDEIMYENAKFIEEANLPDQKKDTVLTLANENKQKVTKLNFEENDLAEPLLNKH